MIDIEKEIKKCKHLDNIYILKESGDRTKKYPRIENINSADITQASVKVYNSYTHMYSTKSIYESKKGYYIKANGKRLYLDNFEEGEAMTENKKIEQLKKRIDKVFDKITTDEIEQRIKEDKFIKISDQLIGGYYLNIVYDKETKVEYAFYGKGGLQVLIDAEGNPLLYKEGE